MLKTPLSAPVLSPWSKSHVTWGLNQLKAYSKLSVEARQNVLSVVLGSQGSYNPLFQESHLTRYR